MRWALPLAVASLAASCDPAAKTDTPMVGTLDPLGSAAPYESCAASDDCADGLRCVDAVCQVPRLRVADFHAAVGRAALKEGAIGRAVSAYGSAVSSYEDANLDAPADVTCEQGSALTAARMDPEKAEAAARVLHRCLLAVPAGSALYRRALDDLAVLVEVGLDPGHVARDELADLYLSKQPQKPPLDRLKLMVRGDGSRRSTHVAVVERLSGDEAKAKFAPCWEAHWKDTREGTMSVKLPVSYRLRVHEEDPSRDRGVIKVEELGDAAEPAQAAANTCVRGGALELLEATGRSLKADERWESSISIRIEPS